MYRAQTLRFQHDLLKDTVWFNRKHINGNRGGADMLSFNQIRGVLEAVSTTFSTIYTWNLFHVGNQTESENSVILPVAKIRLLQDVNCMNAPCSLKRFT